MVFLSRISLLHMFLSLSISSVKRRFKKLCSILGVIVLLVQTVFLLFLPTCLGYDRRWLVSIFFEFHENGVIVGNWELLLFL